MATKGQKKRDLNIDEEKDAFLLSINKKIRNNNKKLDQIRDLEKKDKSTLNQEQIQKINSRSEVLKSTQYFEGIKDLYYEALKANKDEQKTETTEVKTEVAPQQTITQTVQPQVVQTVNIGETTQRILNLVHFAQIYTDARKRDAHGDKSDGHDFDTVYEFYAKIFTFSESDKFDKLGTKISNANHELESYLNRAETVALRNQSYKHLNDFVEKIAASSHFRDQKADISVPKTTSSQISAIGSELKKEAPVEEVRVPEPKTESPVKAHEKEIPTVEEVERQQQQEAQKQQQHHHHEKEQKHHHKQHHDSHHHGKHQQSHQAEKATTSGQVAWADIDDEKEETKQEEAPQKSNQDDDGFITVTKRTPTTTQRGTRGSRGGNRGGNRGTRGGFKRNGEGRPERTDNDEKREGGDNKEHREYKPKRDTRTAGGERQYVVKNPQNTGAGDNNAQ